MDAKQSVTVVPAVDRAIELLLAIARAGKPLTLAEVSDLTATSRSTAYTTLATLQIHGFVEKNLRFKTYRLGLTLFELGNAYIAQVSLTPAFMECAEQLVVVCGETVKLAMRDGRDVVYLATQEGPQSVRTVALVGARLPAHVTAVGKVLLAQLSDVELERLYVHYDFPARTPNSLSHMATLKEQVEFVRRYGYANDREESSIGVNCVAAPVRDHTGEVVAAMSIGAPNQRMTEARRQELALLVQQYANSLSRTLGWVARVSEPAAVAG
jgi:DNA-binding IclR family transcriptional regulator